MDFVFLTDRDEEDKVAQTFNRADRQRKLITKAKGNVQYYKLLKPGLGKKQELKYQTIYSQQACIPFTNRDILIARQGILLRINTTNISSLRLLLVNFTVLSPNGKTLENEVLQEAIHRAHRDL